jgi:hypothetical protein
VTVKRAQQDRFASQALAGTLPECMGCQDSDEHQYNATRHPSTWCAGYDRYARFWDTGIPTYSVYVEGNDKLPFWAFSSLPDSTCPGAGECLKWCYSFKCWRHCGAFYRQVQNAVLMQTAKGRQHIADAFMALPHGLTVRLYVDGDIDSMVSMRFWWGLLAQRQDLNVYGYSKSWQLFLDYDATGDAWPVNYTLRLSSGSIYGESMRRRMDALPITAGSFDSLPVSHKMPDRRVAPAAWAAWAAMLKATAKEHGIVRAFVCPGKCGDCLPNGEHACGSDRFKGIAVVIGIH